jgi:hypothetical protein
MDFFQWETTGDVNDDSLCFVADGPEGMGLELAYLQLGKPAQQFVPPDPKIALRKEHPGIKLSGFLGNSKNFLILSKAGVAVIEKLCSAQKHEVFPFTLLNHKKRVHSTDYALVNPLTFVAALDQGASEVKLSPKGKVESVERYVLSKAKVADAPHLFRLAEKPVEYVFSRELGRALNAAGVTNVFGTPLDQG